MFKLLYILREFLQLAHLSLLARYWDAPGLRKRQLRLRTLLRIEDLKPAECSVSCLSMGFIHKCIPSLLETVGLKEIAHLKGIRF